MKLSTSPATLRPLAFLRLAVLSLGLSHAFSLQAAPVELRSPDSTLKIEVETDADGALCWSLLLDEKPLLGRARIGVTVDGRDLGKVVTLGTASYGEIDEEYRHFGAHSVAKNRARTLSVPIFSEGRPVFMLQARAYDDGAAWRMIVPGTPSERRIVNGEASSWSLPPEGKVWYFERKGDWKLKSYAGEWISAPVEKLPTCSPGGPVQGTPLVVELAGGRGYVLLSEAALENYSGLRLRALSEGRRVQADFTEGERGFPVSGEIRTPWRATLVARDLDRLVNSTLIDNLCPAPDPKLYPSTDYIKPGRCVWRWWSANTGTPEEERSFVDYAVALGFEYTLVDDGWKDWPEPWTQIRALCAYASSRKVGVFIWKDYKDLKSPDDNWAQLRQFLDQAAAAGVAGVKLDFLNAESKDRIEFSTAALRFAAERRLLVNFHGVAKPTGETRTYPNQITREGIRGLELNRMTEGPIPAWHNAALPFTRFVVGPGDYTPFGLSNPGPTTWAHQLATLVQFLSPMQCLAEHPQMLLENPSVRPALEVLKTIPSTWDETRVLPPSTIGKLSLIARRSGAVWYLSVLNGEAQTRTLDSVPLGFLREGPSYAAVSLTSPHRNDFLRQERTGVTSRSSWSFELGAGDGAVLRFTPEK